MRPGESPIANADRLLTFEVGASLYALPIESVLEVAEADRLTCVPGVSERVAGVMNWHGDPLPIVASRLLLTGGGTNDPEDLRMPGPTVGDEGMAPILREQVLVVSDRAEEAGRLGMSVDRVVGLVEGRAGPVRSQHVVVERRPMDGRVVSVLDPHRLVARAEEIIERAVA
jgi:chemotaxis signal transduction protein